MGIWFLRIFVLSSSLGLHRTYLNSELLFSTTSETMTCSARWLKQHYTSSPSRPAVTFMHSFWPLQWCSCCSPARAAEFRSCCASWTWPPGCWGTRGQRSHPAAEPVSAERHVWGPASGSSPGGRYHPETGRCPPSCLREKDEREELSAGSSLTSQTACIPIFLLANGQVKMIFLIRMP